MLFTTLSLFLVFALNFFLDLGALCIYHFNFRGIPCMSLFYHYVEFYRLVGHDGPNFDLYPIRGIFTFSGKSILLPLMFRVVLSHFMCRVSHKVCFSKWRFWALSCPLRAKVWSRPLSSLTFTGT